MIVYIRDRVGSVLSHKLLESEMDLLDRLPQAAAIALDATYEVIARNALATALMQDFSALALRERNLIRHHFLAQGLRASARPPADRVGSPSGMGRRPPPAADNWPGQRPQRARVQMVEL